jgi:hypothetical protein
MRYTFKKEYYKRRRPGEEPISFHASQKGNRVKATIKMDPVLKKHPDLRKALLAHETSEIKAWATGDTAAHSQARAKEPVAIRNIGGVSGFWREIKRREKR